MRLAAAGARPNRHALWEVETDGGNDQRDNGFHKIASIALAFERNELPVVRKLQIYLSWRRIWVRSAGFYRRIFLQAFQELCDDLRYRRDDP